MLAVVIAAIYAPSLQHGFLYDDNKLILMEPTPDSLGDVATVFRERHWPTLPYYRPLARATMLGQKYLHGDEAAPFHALNLFLIAAIGGLAYAVLRAPGFGLSSPYALLGAGIFALHPVASSCVYPIASGRETLIPVFFMLASFAFYVRGGSVRYGFALLLFACALLSKEQAVVLPILFVLVDALGLSASPPKRTRMAWGVRYAPMLLVLAIYLVFRWQLFGGAGEYDLAIFSHPLGPPLSLLYAMQALLFPNVDLFYEPRFGIWFSVRGLVACLALAVALGAVVRRSEGEPRRRLLFWMGWFAIGLLPTLNILEQEARFAERYVFLAALGGVALLATLASRFPHSSAVGRGWLAVGCLLAMGCAAISVHRGAFYASERAFLDRWVESDPASGQAHLSLGKWYDDHEQYEQAVASYVAVAALWPRHFKSRLRLANDLVRLNRHKEAIPHFRIAVELGPDSAEAHYGYGASLAYLGKNEMAVESLERAIELRPDYPQASQALIPPLVQLGRMEQAQVHLRKALEHHNRTSGKSVPGANPQP